MAQVRLVNWIHDHPHQPVPVPIVRDAMEMMALYVMDQFGDCLLSANDVSNPADDVPPPDPEQPDDLPAIGS